MKIGLNEFLSLLDRGGVLPVLLPGQVALLGPDPGRVERARALLNASGLGGSLLLHLVEAKAPGWEAVAEILDERAAIMGESGEVTPGQAAEGALSRFVPVPGASSADQVLVSLLSRLQDGPLSFAAAVRGCGERLVYAAMGAGLVRRSGDRVFLGKAPRVADPVIPASVEAAPVLPVPEAEGGSPSSDPGDLLTAASRAEGVHFVEARRLYGVEAIQAAVRAGLIDAEIDGTLRRAA